MVEEPFDPEPRRGGPVPVVLSPRPSVLMRIVSAYLRLTPTKAALADINSTDRGRVRNQRRGAAKVPVWHRVGFRFRPHPAGGSLTVVEVSPKKSAPTATIIYLPGGAYINPMISFHWDLACALARENDARVLVVKYPLAPTGTAATVIPELVRLYGEVVDEDGSVPVVAGDSAGGGLAAALAVTLRDMSLLLPHHLALFAPWMDVTLTNQDIEAVVDSDPTLALPGLRWAGALWAADQEPTTPQVSPGYADLSGLCPVTLVVGTHDLLLPDCRAFVDKAIRQDVDAVLGTIVGGFHVCVAATFLPESKKARRWVRSRMALHHN